MSHTRPLSPDLDARIARDPELARLLRQTINESIGGSLREARDYAGMSQAEVAKSMGVSRSRISQIEATEGSSLSLDVLSRYANAVGCRLDIDLVDPNTEESIARIFVVEHVDAWSADGAVIVEGGSRPAESNVMLPSGGFLTVSYGEDASNRAYASAA